MTTEDSFDYSSEISECDSSRQRKVIFQIDQFIIILRSDIIVGGNDTVTPQIEQSFKQEYIIG